jgi:radical SAM protein with 4Fe4S-binding SPASM domain
MITNGTLLEPSAKRLVAAGLDELNISIDGYGRLHDDIRGMPGLFERVRRGVAAVNEQKRLRGARKPFINIQCTINKANYLELEKMIDTAAELGADSLTWHNLIFTTGGILDRQREVDSALESDSSSWNGFLFESGIDPEKLWSVIGRLKRRRTPLRRDVYPDFGKEDFLAYYRAPGSLTAGRRFRCLSPWLVAYVFPDGSVRPCLNSTYSFGDIRTQRFIDAWNSPAACKFRKFLKQRRVFPVCERCTELYRY